MYWCNTYHIRISFINLENRKSLDHFARNGPSFIFRKTANEYPWRKFFSSTRYIINTKHTATPLLINSSYTSDISILNFSESWHPRCSGSEGVMIVHIIWNDEVRDRKENDLSSWRYNHFYQYSRPGSFYTVLKTGWFTALIQKSEMICTKKKKRKTFGWLQ